MSTYLSIQGNYRFSLDYWGMIVSQNGLTRNIYGYDVDSELPSYREIRAIQLIASYTSPTMKCTRVPIPIINQVRVVYEETMILKLRDSIKLIAKAIESSNENITYSANPHTLCRVQKEIGYAQITESYFEFSKQDFRKVIDISNAKLIDMLMNLNKELFKEILVLTVWITRKGKQ